MAICLWFFFLFVSSRRRHTRCALVTGVQTCALPIFINEMLPKLRADPSYLDRMGYQVEVKGRQVSSTSVNWYGSTQSISVRQPPSSDNALGELKILFPNADRKSVG